MHYLLTVLATGLVTWLLIELALKEWRRSAADHWTQQARVLFPVQVSRQIFLWTIPISAVLIFQSFGLGGSRLGIAACSYLGVLLGNFPTDRAINPGLTFGVWAHEVVAATLVRVAGFGAYILAAWFMPPNFSAQAALIAFGCLFFQIAWQYGLAVRLMRWLRLLTPPPARIVALVAEVSSAMNVPVRATWELASCTANALAFVVTRELAFTRRTIVLCSDDELKAICAHELGHLSESRWTRRGRLVGSLILFPLIFIVPARTMEGGIGLVLIVLCMGLLWFGRLKLSQKMEKRADQIACANVADQTGYARALETLYRDNLMPAVMKKKSLQNHPDLYDRMLAAGLTPAYARPAVPAEQHWSSMLTTSIATLLAMYQFVR